VLVLRIEEEPKNLKKKNYIVKRSFWFLNRFNIASRTLNDDSNEKLYHKL
jgi:hypothetical protein